jgi:cyanophycin synthetase
MRVLEIKVMDGPNYWSIQRQQLIVAKVDIEELEFQPTNEIDGFTERLKKLIPSLVEHECSEGHPGGFFERLDDGTWMGHVVEHVALELQWLAGMKCGFGRTRSAGTRGIYYITFAYEIAEAGILALNEAINICETLRKGWFYNFQGTLTKLKAIVERHAFGPSTLSIINEAKSRDIPVRYHDESGLVILGYGKFQKRFRGSIAGSTSHLGVDLVDDKTTTKAILEEAGIPIPVGITIDKPGDLFNAISLIGTPAVIKPMIGNHGRGVTTNIRTYTEFERAFYAAKKICESVIVEPYIEGDDYRLLVINYKFVAAARRCPPYVVGDGSSTIKELIDNLNNDPRRGNGHENLLTKVVIDESTLCILESLKLTLHSIVPRGEKIILKKTANLSTGGMATDVTDEVHSDNIFIAERIARLLDLDICGIDLILKDISRPLSKGNDAVLEVNASPGLRMHLAPSFGISRNVARPIVDMLYPKGAPSRIPVIAITGTNGKTTTTRLIAHMASNQGLVVGTTTTDGIYIDGHLIEKGDCTGPQSTRRVLQDATVDMAVLECARGGILRAGLGFDKCDVSVITNVSEDHLDIDGIRTLDEMAKLKAVVAQSTSSTGYSILNADDDKVYEIARGVNSNVAFFSIHPDNPRILAHRKNGGLAAVVENGRIVVYNKDRKTIIAGFDDIPLTFGGDAECMVQNVMAAVLTAIVQKFDLKAIQESLRTFVPSSKLTPGRMNVYHFNDFDVMVDYGHNASGLTQIKKFLDKINAPEKIGIVTAVGDRRDKDIEEVGFLSASMFDQVIIRLDKNLRGRSAQDLTTLLQNGIKKKNPFLLAPVIPDEIEALQYAMETASKGAYITVFTDQAEQTCNYLQQILDRQTGESIIETPDNLVSRVLNV